MVLSIRHIFPKNKQKFFAFLFNLLFLVFFFLILNGFRVALSGVSSTFGYMDYHHHWRVLDDFASFKMPFRDYFHRASYGWFYLLLQFIPYLTFKRTFFGLLIVRHLYLPFVALITSYFVAKNVLKKLPLITIFLFLCLLFRVNYIYESPRHLIAELSLSFFILYFFKEKTKYLLISGIIAGLAVLTSFEYGVALNLAILLVFLISFFSDAKLTKPFFNKFLLGEIAVLAPYFSWLYIKGVFHNYLEYTVTRIVSFYYSSPCSDRSFPRLSEIRDLAPTSQWLIFKIPIEFLQRLNFYIVFVFFILNALVLFALFLKNKKFSKNSLVKLTLIIYGFLIFIRTLDTPCTGYFSYSLIPFFLLIVLLIKDAFRGWQKKPLGQKRIITLAMIIAFSWLILTEHTGTLTTIFGRKEVPAEKETYANEYYSPAGWFIRKDFVRDYQEVVDYVQSHSMKDDFLYVYPWGPYNHLTDRQSPSGYPVPGQLIREKIVKELQIKKPRFVVINIYNNLGMVRYGMIKNRIVNNFPIEEEWGPLFVNESDPVVKYIIENYQVVLKNDLAVVMEPRTVSFTLGEKRKKIASLENWEEEGIGLVLMKETGSLGKYAITGENASWTLNLKEPFQASEVAVELKLDGNPLTKHLTRYFLNLSVIVSGMEEPYFTKSIAHKDWQTIEINWGKPEEIKEIKVEVRENTGLIWWLNPDYLEIKEIIFYLPSY